MLSSNSKREQEKEEMSFISCFQVFLLSSFLLLFVVEEVQARLNIFNVIDYGARGDLETNNTEAFDSTWHAACESRGGRSIVLIPKGNFLVGPMVFSGPCEGPINFHLRGNLVAPTDKASLLIGHWISFRYLDQLTINGGGTLDGQGSSAWPYNTNRKPLPISLTFDFLNNSGITHITFLNSKGVHFHIFTCDTIMIDNVHIKAPDDSPNTDGIHVAISNKVKILNSVIGTGDDCISMGPGSKNIKVDNVRCGPGHGISIGSLGAGPDEDDVIGVNVTNCNLTNTMYGIRIKTFPRPYKSIVSNIAFDHINFYQVDNPIIINQEYWRYNSLNKDYSGVKINDVRFSNMQGTSLTLIAVNLKCSQRNPCEKLELRNINIVYQGRGGPAKSFCFHAHGTCYGQQHPPSCLIRDHFST